MGWSLAAACSIVAERVYGIPFVADRLAPLVPFAFEKRIGDAVDQQVRFMFGGKVCDRPDGQRAFTAMVNKLSEAGGISCRSRRRCSSSIGRQRLRAAGRKDLSVRRASAEGADRRTKSPACSRTNLGHVQHRDSLRKVIQTGGTSFLIGLLFGDITGGGAVIFAARSIIDASYSRDAEHDADEFAIERHAQARPLAAPDGRISGAGHRRQEIRRATILDSHPMSEERLARMKQEDRPNTGPDILSAQEWSALKGICKAK